MSNVMQYKQQLIRTEKMSLIEKNVYPWNIKSKKKVLKEPCNSIPLQYLNEK